MKFNSEYISMAMAYMILILYVILENNLGVTITLIIFVFFLQILFYVQLKRKLSNDKETSVSKLQFRLAKTKQKQEESYKRFTSLSQSFGSGLIMIDEDGIIQLANKDFTTYFGSNYNNKDYKVLTDIKNLFKFVNQAYLLEKSLRQQINYNGKVFDLISTPLFEENMFKGTLILCHDITLIKNAENYQKRFTADVSHELRTPLSAIKGFSEILLRDVYISKEERQEFMELIQTESARMEVILNDLMIISKMDRLDYELELTRQDIKSIVDECFGILSHTIKSKNLDYYIDVQSQIMEFDKFKMSQVIRNIVKNAINYTDEGQINIRGYKNNSEYVIEISDTGIGIKKENFDNVFKRFYRVDKARSRDSGGSGLGLSISKNVVMKHNGNISIESELNKGTTFTIKLPIKE